MRRLVIDSSVSLKWWLDDEEHVTEAREILKQAYAGRIIPVVPNLWHYEVANGIRTAVFRKKINKKQGKVFIDELLSLELQTHSIVLYIYLKSMSMPLNSNMQFMISLTQYWLNNRR